MWYFGCCKQINKYMFGKTEESEFDDIGPDSLKNDNKGKVEIPSGSNLDSPPNKYGIGFFF